MCVCVCCCCRQALSPCTRLAATHLPFIAITMQSSDMVGACGHCACFNCSVLVHKNIHAGGIKHCRALGSHNEAGMLHVVAGRGHHATHYASALCRAPPNARRHGGEKLLLCIHMHHHCSSACATKPSSIQGEKCTYVLLTHDSPQYHLSTVTSFPSMCVCRTSSRRA